MKRIAIKPLTPMTVTGRDLKTTINSLFAMLRLRAHLTLPHLTSSLDINTVVKTNEERTTTGYIRHGASCTHFTSLHFYHSHRRDSLPFNYDTANIGSKKEDNRNKLLLT